MFINGIILGVSEMLSAITSGFLISLTSSTVAFEILAMVGLTCNTVLTYVLNDGGITAYIVLFIALQGIGGVYTCLFVIIGEKIPVTQVGAVFTA